MSIKVLAARAASVACLSWGRTRWLHILVLLLISCVALGRLTRLSVLLGSVAMLDLQTIRSAMRVVNGACSI